jgi:hypothetical protein
MAEVLKNLVPGRFCIDSDGPFPGYHVPGVHWNGWECPYFTKEVAEQILPLFYITGEWRYIPGKDEFQSKDPNDHDDEYGPEVWGSVDAEIDGKIVRLYPVGAWAWIWDLCGGGK